MGDDGSVASQEGGDPHLNRLTDLLAQLDMTEGRHTSRPKVIHSRVFKLGDNFQDFSSHFVECVRAAHGFSLPTDQGKLDDACLLWLPSKLEPGPTLSAFSKLDGQFKSSWPLLNEKLKEIFANDSEREIFLADVASFRRGQRSLLEYKTELLRLTTTYLPDLQQIVSEFQRELPARFIEGLDDEDLKKKLRRHCRRDRNTLDNAYNYALDYEAAEIQSSLREGTPAIASFSTNPPTTTIGDSTIASVNQRMASILAQQMATRAQVDHLLQESKKADSRLDALAQEICRFETSADARFFGLNGFLVVGQPTVKTQILSSSASRHPSPEAEGLKACV